MDHFTDAQVRYFVNILNFQWRVYNWYFIMRGIVKHVELSDQSFEEKGIDK